MQKLAALAFCFGLSAGAAFSQTFGDYSSQQTPSQGITVDCSDPLQAGTPECARMSGVQGQGRYPGASEYPLQRVPQLTQYPSANSNQYLNIIPLNPSQIRRQNLPVRPETEFEQMVADSAGKPLPLFGQSLFVQPPSTFAPFDTLPVPDDYVIGPGDELLVTVCCQVEADLRVIVDRSGQIYVPKVGQVAVSGVHYGDLEQHLKAEISKFFKNFKVTANLGRLRSIQVLVVGNARYPGTYTISALSTLVNAVFASGGPTSEGSLRDIQVRRNGAVITDFDFYDLLIKGDKSKDVRLLPGDVLYFPPIGPLVGISGSVNSPAIYEIKADSKLNDLIEMAGGLNTVADSNKITVDRVVEHQARKTLEFPYDEQSKALALRDGDIVHVFSIVSRFEDTVTLRGSVANPGRYPWKPGMRVRDLIPNAEALLTRQYWLYRAAMVNGRATEYPVRLPRCNASRQTNAPMMENAKTPNASAPNNASPSIMSSKGALLNGNMALDAAAQSGYPSVNGQPNSIEYANDSQGPCIPSDQYSNGVSTDRPLSQSNDQTSKSSEQGTQTEYTAEAPNRVRNIADDVRRSAPEINWDYATIQRVNLQDLSSKLIWLSPRKAILERDDASNLELQPGDIVTIFSQTDVSVPQAERPRYVVIEGEVKRPGVYKLEPDERLHSILERAGGLTENAYVYGTRLTRESARVEQQRSLDQLAAEMELEIRQTAMAVAASASPGDVGQLQAAQQGIVGQLRGSHASGRVAIPVNPSDKAVNDFPDMDMEDGDRMIIPHTPSTVSVVGNVYSPGSFIFESQNTAGAYLEMAGKGKPHSDLHHAFVLRANGVVVAANNVNGPFAGNKFDRLHLYPGDEIVVPFKIPTGAFVRGLRDWSQIASQLAFTGASVAIISGH